MDISFSSSPLKSPASGIPQVKAALNKIPSKLDFRVAVSKLIASIVALGVGLPLGKEGPTVQIGAAAAAILNRIGLRSYRSRRQLIAAGAGAGLAAAFNAPLAGIIFVIEELLKEISSVTIGTALLACFFAAIVSRWLGNHSLDIPLDSIFPKAFFGSWDLPFCLILGAVSGVMGVFYNRGIILCSSWNEKLLGHCYVLRIGIAGLVCGLVLALLPQTFREVTGVRQLLMEGRGVNFALVVFGANFALSIFAYGSGSPGGLFAPSLTIGSALGFLIGTVEVMLIPSAGDAPLTLALAGMGAFFTGVARVPITASVIVFEITADFNVLLPLLISSITAYYVGEKLMPGSIYDLLLERQGINLPSSNEPVSPLDFLTVAECMQHVVQTVTADVDREHAFQMMMASTHKGFPVVRDGSLIGFITRAELDHAGQTVGEIMIQPAISINDNESLNTAIAIMDQKQINRLPVTDGEKLKGIITRTDIIKSIAKI